MNQTVRFLRRALFVREYDASGTESWTRQFGTSGTDHASGLAALAGGSGEGARP